jgi:hypothetical protein
LDGGISNVTVRMMRDGEEIRALSVAAEDWNGERERRDRRESERRSMTRGARTPGARHSDERERERRELPRTELAARGEHRGVTPWRQKFGCFEQGLQARDD